MRSGKLIRYGLVAAVVLLVGIGLWQTRRGARRGAAVLVREPARVMGTTCTLTAVPGPEGVASAEAALRDAEAALRAVEARMSVWIAGSEISRFNQAPAGEDVALSADTLEVLRAARRGAVQTRGAFDVTCGPLIELWRRAGSLDRLPTEAELAGARAASSWRLVHLDEDGARKDSGEARVDLGGIAKGYGTDRAVESLRRAGVEAGVVDVGGDLRCFGHPPDKDRWPVDIRDPFRPGTIGALLVGDAAVCTSGNYARFAVIEGKRYSHIIDPRTGSPAEAAPSVTVVAPTAMAADMWATALSVLGREGLPLLPAGMEALLVLGTPEEPRIVCTPGAVELLEASFAAHVEVHRPSE